MVLDQVAWLGQLHIAVTPAELLALTTQAPVLLSDLRSLQPGQVAAIRAVLHAVAAKDGSTHFITGPAGCGKTAALKIVARLLEMRKMKHLLCAYTNSATAELGGNRSFEAELGVAYLRGKAEFSDISDTTELPVDRVLDYLCARKNFVFKPFEQPFAQ